MSNDYALAGFSRTVENGVEILSVRPQVLTGPLAAARTVYEIRDRKLLNKREGLLLKSSNELYIAKIESIEVRTGILEKAVDAHDIVFRAESSGEYVWHNVPNAAAVKKFVQALIEERSRDAQHQGREEGSDPLSGPTQGFGESQGPVYSAYKGTLRRNCGLDDIRFDPNLSPPPETSALLAKWRDSDAKSKRFPKSESIVIPLPPSHVWRVLLATRDMEHWLHDHEPNQIPNPFGPGALIADRSFFSEAHYFIIDCEPGKSLLFRYDNWNWEAVLEPSGRDETRFVLTTWSSVPKWAAPIARVLLSGLRREYEERATAALVSAVRKFRNLCYDHAYFGGPLRSNDNVHVVTAPEDGSIVRFFSDQNGKPLAVGDRVGYVRLGYFHPADATNPEQYKDRLYFDTNAGIVEILFKKDGDRVNFTDRVVLIRREQAEDSLTEDSARDDRAENQERRYPPNVEELRANWGLPMHYKKTQIDTEFSNRFGQYPAAMRARLRSEYELLEPFAAEG